jgi:hypothetical protein
MTAASVSKKSRPHRNERTTLVIDTLRSPRCAAAWSAALYALTVLLLSTATACHYLTEPLPEGTEPFSPPAVYARWWAMTEACSGRTGDLATIHWYQVPGAWEIRVHDGRAAAGYEEPSSDRIVLAGDQVNAGSVVRHEMLHALLRQPGHPDAQFRGACAGLVEPPGNPWPLPTREYAELSPESLSVATDAELLPREADGGRWLTVLVTVLNPRGNAVLVAAPGNAVTPPTFGYLLRGPTGGYQGGEVANDSSVLFFGPFETKRWLFEFKVGSATAMGFNGLDSLGPGTYQVRSGYGWHWSLPDTVDVTP